LKIGNTPIKCKFYAWGLNMDKIVTITTHNGSRVCVEHNLRNKRSVGNPDIDPSRSHLNETLVSEPIQRAYERIFGEAVSQYNAKQSREERRIKSYYEHIRNDAKKHPVYEMIIQVGDELNIGNDSPIAKEILMSFISDWKRRNPSLELIGAYIHADEATIHAHLDYIPVATGYIRGMHTQNGLDKALRQQGFDGKTASLTPQILWEKRENAYLEQLCTERGFTVIHPEREKKREDKRVHQTVEEYKTERFAAEIADSYAYSQRLEQNIAELERNKEKLEKELNARKKELEWTKGKVMTEKQVANFKNPDKDFLGRVKTVQTINIADYKSLVATAARVKDVDKREKSLNEREAEQKTEYDKALQRLECREQNLNRREEANKRAELNVAEREQKVKQGAIYNTDRRVVRVENDIKALKDYCSQITFGDDKPF